MADRIPLSKLCEAIVDCEHKTAPTQIELNQQMNRTLEAIARTIFKSWFVNFDPVRAKMEGRQPVGMDAATADLFPDAFEDSPLGKIPKGGRVKPLPEVVEVNPSRSLSKGQIAPYLDMKSMPTQGHRPDNWIDRAFNSGTRFINGDTLMARITPCLENGKTALYLMAVPSEQIIQVFGDSVKPLMAKTTANSEQSRTIATIRDTLLPKLLSGETRVKEADKIVEDMI